jgi:protein-S-isoprenylcysteine O-methyltransferase Ste14
VFGLTPRQLADLPPVWLAVFAAGAWAVSRMLPPSGLGAAGLWTGRALILLGLLLMALALVEFRRHRTTVIPHKGASALVTSGIYRLSRNPIYLGDALILSGLCLAWDCLPALILVPAFMFLISNRFIRPEEDRLRTAFGTDFASWSTRTRRWI